LGILTPERLTVTGNFLCLCQIRCGVFEYFLRHLSSATVSANRRLTKITSGGLAFLLGPRDLLTAVKRCPGAGVVSSAEWSSSCAFFLFLAVVVSARELSVVGGKHGFLGDSIFLRVPFFLALGTRAPFALLAGGRLGCALRRRFLDCGCNSELSSSDSIS